MELQIIKQQDVLGKEFRIYGDFENPLFLAKDVAEWIDYSKTSQGYFDVSNMLKSVDEDEKVKEFTTTNNLRSGCEQWFLTENGLYEVLMLSRKPIAKQFKKEVKKILHEIRTKGSFGVPRSFAEALQLAADQQKRIEEQQLVIEQSKQKVEFFDKVTGSSDTCDMKEVAKILNFKGGREKQTLRDSSSRENPRQTESAVPAVRRFGVFPCHRIQMGGQGRGHSHQLEDGRLSERGRFHPQGLDETVQDFIGCTKKYALNKYGAT